DPAVLREVVGGRAELEDLPVEAARRLQVGDLYRHDVDAREQRHGPPLGPPRGVGEGPRPALARRGARCVPRLASGGGRLYVRYVYICPVGGGVDSTVK